MSTLYQLVKTLACLGVLFACNSVAAQKDKSLLAAYVMQEHISDEGISFLILVQNTSDHAIVIMKDDLDMSRIMVSKTVVTGPGQGVGKGVGFGSSTSHANRAEPEEAHLQSGEVYGRLVRFPRVKSESLLLNDEAGWEIRIRVRNPSAKNYDELRLGVTAISRTKPVSGSEQPLPPPTKLEEPSSKGSE